MKLERIEAIPETVYGKPKMDLRGLLDEFLASDMQYAHVILDPGDYYRPEYARITLVEACRRYGYNIKVISRNGANYLAKRGA